MVGIRFFATLILLMNFCSMQSSFRLVFDADAIKEVSKNTFIQIGVEAQHNKTLDSIESAQRKTAQYCTAMSIARASEYESKKNSRGFDVESAFYRCMANLACDIVNLAPDVIKGIKSAPLAGKTQMIIEVGGLVEDCTQLTKDFRSIVTNCSVTNPLGSKHHSEEKKDGHNLLERSERLEMALTIIRNLKRIKVRLKSMAFYAHYATWNTVFRSLDPESWSKYQYGMFLSNKIQRQWKNLK